MGASTGLLWCDATWNPGIGCSHISPGCDHCWAEKMAVRLAGQKIESYPDVIKNGKWSGITRQRHTAYAEVMSMKTASVIAVCLMGDLFHKTVEDFVIRRVLYAMSLAPQHTYLILTKRAFQMRKFFDHYVENQIEGTPGWPWPNVWLGVTAENNAMAKYRIYDLLRIPAAIHFVSFEPLLEPILLRHDWCSPDGVRIDWAIAGCESINGKPGRPAERLWFEQLHMICSAWKIPFFFKQAVIDGQVTDLPPLLKTGLPCYEFPRMVSTIKKCEDFLTQNERAFV